MARPGKTTVDYFPHVTQTGKTIAILESRWGNDGYAFWFKLLELIGSTEGFCYDCNKSADWEYLLSKTRVSEEVADAILNKLAEIEAIDAELWQGKRVWAVHFLDGVKVAFEKRKNEIPQKPSLSPLKPTCSDISGAGNQDASLFQGEETGERTEPRLTESNKTERTGECEGVPSSPVTHPSDKPSDKKPTKNLPPEAMDLAEYLKAKILEWKPNAKIPHSLIPWADCFRLMMQQDRRDPDEVAAVILFATASPFWRANILSATKVRNHFDTLQGQMMTPRKKANHAESG